MTPDNYGRAHKTAAWAYLVRTYLYAKDWDNAIKYANMIVASGKHKLLDNFEDVFKIKNNWSSEYIWSVTSSAENTGLGSIFPGVCLEDKGWGAYNGWEIFIQQKNCLTPMIQQIKGEALRYFKKETNSFILDRK